MRQAHSKQYDCSSYLEHSARKLVCKLISACLVSVLLPDVPDCLERMCCLDSKVLRARFITQVRCPDTCCLIPVLVLQVFMHLAAVWQRILYGSAAIYRLQSCSSRYLAALPYYIAATLLPDRKVIYTCILPAPETKVETSSQQAVRLF